MSPLAETQSGPARVSTFWQRLAAGGIDVLLSLPVFALQMQLAGQSRALAFIMELLGEFTFVGYLIYCHGRHGRTIGKRVMKLRVVREDGGRIEWPEAWMRSVVDVVFAVFTTISMWIALASMGDGTFRRTDGWVLTHNGFDYEPWALGWVPWASIAWLCAQPIAILCNPRRRALHDFIAHTVVVSERAAPVPPRIAAAARPV